jgi:hypothetical protein
VRRAGDLGCAARELPLIFAQCPADLDRSQIQEIEIVLDGDPNKRLAKDDRDLFDRWYDLRVDSFRLPVVTRRLR